MKSFTTCALVAAAGLLAASTASADLVTAADFTFDDASALAPFTQTGDPTVAGGQLVLDGDDFVSIADPLAGAGDNFVVDILLTADSFGTFDFAWARSTGANNDGLNLLFQDFGGGPGSMHALQSGIGIPASGPQLATGTATTISLAQVGGEVSIYVNGALVAGPVATATPAGVTDLTIGAHPFDGAISGFNGSVDRIRLSTVSLGAGESLAGDSGNDNFLQVVPEPGSLALLGLGGLMVARRRRG